MRRNGCEKCFPAAEWGGAEEGWGRFLYVWTRGTYMLLTSNSLLRLVQLPHQIPSATPPTASKSSRLVGGIRRLSTSPLFPIPYPLNHSPKQLLLTTRKQQYYSPPRPLRPPRRNLHSNQQRQLAARCGYAPYLDPVCESADVWV